MADFSKITDVNGNQHTVKDSTARTGAGTSFDNTGTGLAATNVQGAITELNTNLSQKANTSDVNSALALKANTADVNTALAAKADISSVNSLAGSLAMVETSPATANHAVGDLIVFNNQLYKVTVAIASGEAIVVGTNVQADSVADEIESVNNEMNYLQREVKSTRSFEQLTGTRISIFSSTLNKCKKMTCSYDIGAGTYTANIMSVETSGYAANGNVLYPVTPTPANFTVSNRNDGLYIIVTAEVVGDMVKTDIVVRGKTNGVTLQFLQQIAKFSVPPESLRTIILWHYMAGATATVTCLQNNTGNFQILDVA